MALKKEVNMSNLSYLYLTTRSSHDKTPTATTARLRELGLLSTKKVFKGHKIELAILEGLRVQLVTFVCNRDNGSTYKATDWNYARLEGAFQVVAGKDVGGKRVKKGVQTN